MDLKEAFDTNRNTWNQKVAVHAESDFYNMKAFKEGQTSLNRYEIEALGDLSGESLLHLQCHFGQDTLSFSRMGAKCTGVDLSDKAVALAEQLNTELALDARFVCCNVLDTSKHISETFDVVFTSYGTIGWLPDLRPWAQMISERLKVGGIFYIVEFHPIAWMFDYTVSPPEMKYGYHQKEAIYEEYEGTYGDTNSKMTSKEYGWNHSLSEIISSLLEAGLEITNFKEHDASPYDIFPDLVKNDEGFFEMKTKRYPLLFEIKAVKK
ncbi:class I SAM-dependent methyltransferase [Ulvibacter litoralis]|uniref:Methyltransferase domain-containing protein n=1 Tax=Ulvibacter litoralis TaxID=227084 RepID=A0A1G7GJV3_9FLAO|nr:class I SAM-dependent methyltransferase [Ulvibacter litoralis]GHC55904.1 type 12 methyltransferase [Ulvibacter litoralis]SDE88396.1 Methyltransferase domain-containing protein [Ulvibacter litoralis]